MSDWSSAPCLLVGPTAFYDEPWPDDKLDAEVLERTRDAYCRDCHLRRACLGRALDEERGAAIGDRWGLQAYLSPGQRESVEKRGIAHCPDCDRVRDPVLLAQGILKCPVNCGRRTVLVVPPPHEGDQWTKRHTTLSRRIVGWVIDNTQPGEEVVLPAQMARLMGGIRHSDVARVYRELVADGTLIHADERYLRGATLASRNWSPKWTDATPIETQEV